MSEIFDYIKTKLCSINTMLVIILLISTWSIYIQDQQINRDGVLYLKQAYLFSIGDWDEGYYTYKWPLFGLLISFFHKLTGLGLQISAHFIDITLFLIASFFYFKILKLIYKNDLIIFYGGLLLISFFPIMDDYVGMILRDHGLWAFCMSGTYFYFLYLDNKSLKNNLCWQLSFALAGLFRPEGLVFLFLIPWINLIFFKDFEEKPNIKIKNFLKENITGIFLLTVISFMVIMDIFFDINNVGRLREFFSRPMVFITNLTSPMPIISSNMILNDLIIKYPTSINIGFMTSIIITKWSKGLGLLGFVLLLLFFKKSFRFSKIKRKALYFFILTSLILLIVNFLNSYVFSNRWLTYHWLWVLILLTPILHRVYEDKYFKTKPYFKFLISLIICIQISFSIIDKKNKNNEIDAAEYLSGFSSLDSVKLINSDRVGYYAGMTMQQLIYSSKLELINTDWIVIKSNYEDLKSNIDFSEFIEDRIFNYKKNYDTNSSDLNKIFIFKRRKSDDF